MPLFRCIGDAWIERTGNLYAMTSNNWNGFTASMEYSSDPSFDFGQAYQVFDNSVSTGCANNNGNLAPQWWQIIFPKEYRLGELKTALYATEGPDGFGPKAYNIYGLTTSGEKILMFEELNDGGDIFYPSIHTHTVPAQFQEIPFIGLRIEIYQRGGLGWYRQWHCQVSKWWEE